MIFPIFPVLLATLLLTILTITARRCRGDYSPVRFMLRLGLWTTIWGLVVAFGYFIIVTLSFEMRIDDIKILAWIGLAGLILGVFLYLLNLPFMILGFTSPFFRERLQRCLGLPLIPKGPDTTLPPEIADPSQKAVDNTGGQG